jgi:Uma2 family endonuclease
MGAIPKTLNGRLSGSVRKYVSEAEFVKKYSDEDIRAEWVDGKVVEYMSDSDLHNDLVGFIYYLLSTRAALTDAGIIRQTMMSVRFEKLKRRRIPDILFLSKRHFAARRENHIEGPPDLAMEVVSKDSVARDYHEKLMEYQTAGVREYWIIDPLSKNVTAYVLKSGKYSQIKESGGKVRSNVLKGFFLKPEWLWANPRPNVLKLLKEMGVK